MQQPQMRIGEVARRAGVRGSLVRRNEDIGVLRLPEIDALIDRAQRVRAWLGSATGCDCQGIEGCALFDAAALPVARRARQLPVTGRGGSAR